jgi:hypothetical protein
MVVLQDIVRPRFLAICTRLARLQLLNHLAEPFLMVPRLRDVLSLVLLVVFLMVRLCAVFAAIPIPVTMTDPLVKVNNRLCLFTDTAPLHIKADV